MNRFLRTMDLSRGSRSSGDPQALLDIIIIIIMSTGQRRRKERRGVLTGQRLLVALPHGDEVPQAGVELLHDGLEEKPHEWLVREREKIRTHTHTSYMTERHSLLGHEHTYTQQSGLRRRRSRRRRRRTGPSHLPCCLAWTQHLSLTGGSASHTERDN